MCQTSLWCATLKEQRCSFSPHPTVQLTLLPTASEVYWFPTGCVPYVPTSFWLINSMAVYLRPVSSHEFSDVFGSFALPFCSQRWQKNFNDIFQNPQDQFQLSRPNLSQLWNDHHTLNNWRPLTLLAQLQTTSSTYTGGAWEAARGLWGALRCQMAVHLSSATNNSYSCSCTSQLTSKWLEAYCGQEVEGGRCREEGSTVPCPSPSPGRWWDSNKTSHLLPVMRWSRLQPSLPFRRHPREKTFFQAFCQGSHPATVTKRMKIVDMSFKLSAMSLNYTSTYNRGLVG
jgi:hypothetical protein